MNNNTNTSSPRDAQWREELRIRLTARERTSIPRVKMPELDPDYRVTCNEEVNSGLSAEWQLPRLPAVSTVPTRSA